MTTELIWFNTDWKAWIKTNVENGQDKNSLFKILLDEGFTYQAIREEMQFEPKAKTDFSAVWKTWIKTNVADGCDKNALVKILLNEGFAYKAIQDEMQFEAEAKTDFSAVWKTWIETNVNDGCDKNALFKILLDEGFDYQSILQEMHFEPSVPIEHLINPLKPKEQTQETNSLPAVNLKQLFIPNGKKLSSDTSQVFMVNNFLDTNECETLVTYMRQNLSITALNNNEAHPSFNQGGGCDVCDLGVNQNPMLVAIEQRMCKLVGIDPSYSEPLHWHYLGIDHNLKPYAKYLEQHEMDPSESLLGHRTFTVMIYLNEVEAGGGSHFSAPNTTITPKTGLAVIWSNLNDDGSPRSTSARKTLPIIKGYQAVITKWFRSDSRLSAPNKLSMFTRDANELIPVYTEAGFTKAKMPQTLFSEVQDFYNSNRHSLKEETVAGAFVVNTTKSKTSGSSLVELSTELRAKIHDNLKALLENWCGKELMPTYVYGIRIYHRGTALKNHRDRLATHIIGVIINIDQEVDEDWILVIEDHQHRCHHITLKPGEMIFYESGRLIHGRPSPLNGNLFANIFCHFKPTDYLPRAVTQET